MTKRSSLLRLAVASVMFSNLHCGATPAPATTEDGEQATAKGWKLSLLVPGDAACDPQRAPEPLEITVADAKARVEGVTIVTVTDPLRFTQPPYAPDPKTRAFLEGLAQQPANLGDAATAAKYEASARDLFARAFAAPVPVTANLRVLSATNASMMLLGLDLSVKDLARVDAWYATVAAKLDGVSPSLIERLLIYGTVQRDGSAPRFRVTFGADTIITGGAHNEVHDTTLCQLRTGAFDVAHVPKADIGIAKIVAIQRAN